MNEQYWLSMAGIIIGCLGIGFSLGSMATARAARRMVEEKRENVLDAEVIDA